MRMVLKVVCSAERSGSVVDAVARARGSDGERVRRVGG